MKKRLDLQYNKIFEDFKKLRSQFNVVSDECFQDAIQLILNDQVKTIIDLGCGDGNTIKYFIDLGLSCAGVDKSSEMAAFASEHTGADIRCEDFSKTSFKNDSFDLCISKWAMQTAYEITPIYDEAARILKRGGIFIFLVTHPFRQFIEKKKQSKNYFETEIVDSIIFDGAITVQEPTHTLAEYLGINFTKLFHLLGVDEGAEFPAAEQIGGDMYPTYMIVLAQKK